MAIYPLTPWIYIQRVSSHQCRALFGVGYTVVMEKAMAPHSSTLAWKIPWVEEPGGLLSMGSHRVGHDWSDLAAVAAAAYSGENCSVVSDSLQPHGLYSPWNSPGQNPGVGGIFLSRGSSQPRDLTQVSCIAGGFFTSWATGWTRSLLLWSLDK